MTRKEFMEELAKTLRLTGEQAIFVGTSVFRVQIPMLSNSRMLCPLTYLCWRKTHRFYANGEWDSAARTLGVAHTTALQIVGAADATVGKRSLIRRELLAACDLPGK